MPNVITTFKTCSKRGASTSLDKSLDRDSFTSFFAPWQSKSRPPPIYPNAQTGPVTNGIEFLLFFVAVILLVITLGLSAISIWSLISKRIYISVVNYSTELAYFAIPAAFLSLPSSWILFNLHNDKASRTFLILVLILLSISIGLMSTAVYIGFTHKFSTRLFVEELRNFLNKYLGEDRDFWDTLQTKFNCCGIDNFTDWLKISTKLPDSCCTKTHICSENNTSPGCLQIIISTLTSNTCLFSGMNCVALGFLCWSFMMVMLVNFIGKKEGE